MNFEAIYPNVSKGWKGGYDLNMKVKRKKKDLTEADKKTI